MQGRFMRAMAHVTGCAVALTAFAAVGFAQPAAKPAAPVAAVPAAPVVPARLPNEWRVTKDRWSEADEREYSDFVFRIGESGCNTVNKCMWDDSNPYRGTNPPGTFYYADCADLPYFLRAYFAWKKGLPFSYVTAVSPRGSTRDIRYTLAGNRVASRKDLTTGIGRATEVLSMLRGNISSAMFRLHPTEENTDLYSVAIQPKSIRPGTVIYDPNGHVAVVYKVEKDGRVRFIDAHPDNSLTRGTYGQKFVRSRPGMGAGFKNWRPIRLVNYTQGAGGALLGGVVQFTPNKDIPDYSWEQFFGTNVTDPRDGDWASGKFMIGEDQYEYYDFVRTRMAGGSLSYEPLAELRNMMRSNCEDIKYRAEAVDLAIKAGIHLKPQIQRLPPNIYGTEGEWEEYSTPSRDARLKTAFKEKRDMIERLVMDYRAGSKRIVYTGANIAADLIKAYDEEANACAINYTRSDGSQKTLGYEEVRRRLFLISFDPYHCVERRWGASDPAELATCRDGADKTAWYKAEQRLRNQIDRTYEARMDHDLSALQAGRGEGTGVDTPPDVDLRSWLQRELTTPTPVPAKPVSSLTDPAAPKTRATQKAPRTAPPAAAAAATAPARPGAVQPVPAMVPAAQPAGPPPPPAPVWRDTTIGRDPDGVGSKVPRDKWDDPREAPFSPKKADEKPAAPPAP
jgi:hypothetical protein